MCKPQCLINKCTYCICKQPRYICKLCVLPFPSSWKGFTTISRVYETIRQLIALSFHLFTKANLPHMLFFPASQRAGFSAFLCLKWNRNKWFWLRHLFRQKKCFEELVMCIFYYFLTYYRLKDQSVHEKKANLIINWYDH